MKTPTKLWISLGVMIVLSPLGLILPAKYGAGTAWGEWSAEELHGMIGYTPARMRESWKAPLPDYAASGQDNAPMRSRSISYAASAVIGAALVGGVTILIGKALAHRDGSDSS